MTVGYGFGRLYRYRHGAYVLAVAALDRSQAIAAVERFLVDRGESFEEHTVRSNLRPAKTIGTAQLVIAVPSYATEEV